MIPNTTKFLNQYAPGNVPEFIEGDVFKIIIPTKNDAVNDATNDAVNDAVKGFVRVAVSDVVSDAVVDRLIKEVLLLLVEDGKSLKDFMVAFNVARATMQRDMALLKENQFVIFDGASKSGVYRLTEYFKLKLNMTY